MNQSWYDMLEESPGIHHERGVIHTKHNGSLKIDPFCELVTAAPTTTNPQNIQMNILPGVVRSYPYGRMTDGISSLDTPSSSYTGQNILLTRMSDTQFEIFRISYYKTAPTKIYTISRAVWTISTYIAGTIKFSRLQTYYDVYGSPSVPDISWADRQSRKAFEKAWAEVKRVSWNPVLRTKPIDYPTSVVREALLLTPIPSPEYVFYRANTILYDRSLKDDESLPGEKHFGDLVMEASERVNATNINVLAFLRDLKRPLDMVPKLKNLSSLKTWASNFLAVKYGVLPTISDLQNIIGAFKRIKPQLDRSGNRLFYAGSTSSAVSDTSVTYVTQHVKLGVAKEDNGLEALEDGLESIGMLPTFENLWDLIPYSFVLDWFVSVGNFLERVDTRVRLLRFNIRYVTMSRKVIVDTTIEPSDIPYVSGTMKRVHYHRWVSDHAPVPPLSLQSALTDFDHWLESAALIIQRAK